MALALTSKRRAVAAVASAVAAVALAVAIVGRSCTVVDRGPESAVRRLFAAANAGDRGTVFDLLTPATQRRLADLAHHATDLVGSSVRYSPLDMISIGASTDATTPTDVTVVERVGDRAVVEIVSGAGRGRVTVVRIDGQWRIDMSDYAAP